MPLVKNSESPPATTDSATKEGADEPFEDVRAPKVKMEVSDDDEDDYSSDYNKNVHDEKFKQSSILEAVLDGKDQGIVKSLNRNSR